MIRNHNYIKEYIGQAKMRNGKLRYAGYVYVDSEVRYNNVNGRYYISIHLRKADYGKRKYNVSTHRDDERGNSDW